MESCRGESEGIQVGNQGWTYVRPVDRFIPARMVDTAVQLAFSTVGERKDCILRTASKA